MDELKLELHSPITEEEWDLITDVDLDRTPSVMFHTKHGKDVEYVKAKHGRWIKRGDNSWECSVCHEISCCNGSYCVDCGADMRGGENEKSM